MLKRHLETNISEIKWLRILQEKVYVSTFDEDVVSNVSRYRGISVLPAATT